jgi:hypothetical protein
MNMPKRASGLNPSMVVMVTPAFDQDRRFLQTVEDLAVQQPVTEFAVEGFAVTVFPGTIRFDIGILHTDWRARYFADAALSDSSESGWLGGVEAICKSMKFGVEVWFALSACP